MNENRIKNVSETETLEPRKKNKAMGAMKFMVHPGNPFFGVGKVTHDIKKRQAELKQEDALELELKQEHSFAEACEAFNLTDNALAEKFAGFRRLSRVCCIAFLLAFFFWVYAIINKETMMAFSLLAVQMMIASLYVSNTLRATQIRLKKLISLSVFLSTPGLWWVRK